MGLAASLSLAPARARPGSSREAAIRALIQDVYADLPPSGDVLGEFRRRGVPTELFADARSALGRLARCPDVLVVMGDLHVMNAVLDHHRLADCILPPYPAPLRDLLHRRIWEGTLGELRAGVTGSMSPLFVKPRQSHLFAGAVVRSLDVVAAHDSVTPLTELICAEVVGWNVECRTYVRDGRVLGSHVYRILGIRQCVPLDNFTGPPALTVDKEVVAEAVARMSRARAGVAGYCLDFGVLATGQTALIEANDALALANCGLPIKDYVDLHIVRWQELMRRAGRPGAPRPVTPAGD